MKSIDFSSKKKEEEVFEKEYLNGIVKVGS
jgi:hypothetical protein